VRWKGYSPAHDQWVDKSDITANNLIMIYERENREEHLPRRSIRTPRRKTNEIIRSIHLTPTNNYYHRHMSSNARAIDTQQVYTDGGNTTTEILSPQMTLPANPPDTATHAVVDTAVFAGTTNVKPVQVRDGTAPLSFVPIGGTFTDNAATQAKPTSPSIVDKDGEDHAPSPFALSPILPQSEKSVSPSPIPIPPRPQPSNQSRADSVHSGLLSSPDPDRECHGPEDLSTLWRQVQALEQYHTAHNRQYPGGFSLPGLAKTAPMLTRLTKMPKPPLSSADFMTDFDIRYRTDVTLTRGLKAVLPQIVEYLDMDDS